MNESLHRPQRREARGGTLVLGGGFAGGYVARFLGRRGATILSRRPFDVEIGGLEPCPPRFGVSGAPSAPA